MSGGRREPGRTVTSKIFGILHAFSPTQPQLSLQEIADRSELPPSTALRLIRQLIAADALERTEDGRYRVALGLWRTGSLAVRARELCDAAAPALQDLNLRMRAGVQLAIHDGTRAVVVDKLATFGSGNARPLVGNREWPFVSAALPVHATAAGKLLLTSLPEEARMRLLNRRLPRFTPRTIVAPAAILSGLESIAHDGVAMNVEELRLGWSALGAHIRDPGGRAIASVAAAVSSTAFDRARLTAQVRKTARAIESCLVEHVSAS